MADERYGGNFTIDISQLRAGLSTANKLIRESQSEFKAASAGLDDWRRSEEGLNAKIDSLNKIIPVQKEKVEALKKEYKRLCDEGMKETESRAIELRTQINKEAAALAENEKELKDQKAALDALKNSSDQAGESLEGLEKDTEKTSGGFTVMKGALSSLVAGGFKLAISGVKKLAAEIVNLGKKADDLNTLAKQSGFTVEELQKFEYAADLIDVSVDDIISAAKKLKKNLASDSKDTAAAFEKLGIQIKDDTGKLRDSTTVFYEVIAALSLIENETERDTLAMQLLGQNADSLAGIIDDGGKALAEYGKEAEKLGVILDQKSVNAANKFNDVIDKAKTTGKGVFYSIGAEIATQLTPEIDSLSKKAITFIKNKDFKSFAKNAASDIKSVGSILLNLGKTTLPVASKAVSFVANNFKTLAITVGTTVTVFKTFQAVMAVRTATTAATAAIAGLSAGVSVATKVQVGWNAAMTANPIGAVAAATALLAGGIALLVSRQKEAVKSTDVLNERQRESVTAAQEAADSWKDQRDAANETVGAQTASVDYIEHSLLPALEKIVDANGKVKDGYESRAAFILGELNKALGTEYTDLQQIIDQYGKVKTAIYDVIKAKKAQIMLEGYEEVYRDAIANADSAETRKSTELQALAKRTEEYEKAEKNYNAAVERLNSLGAASTQQERTDAVIKYQNAKKAYENQKELLEQQKAAYAEAAEAVEEYQKIIISYESASRAALEGETEEVTKILSRFGAGFKTAASLADKSAEERRQTLKDQVISTQITLQTMKDDYEKFSADMTEAEREYAKERIKNASRLAYEALEEYRAVGGGIVDGVADGIGAGTWRLESEVIAAIRAALEAAKDEADINSPSKVFHDKVGLMIGKGIAAGIEDSTGSAVGIVRRQIRSIEAAYNPADIVSSVKKGLNTDRGGSTVNDNSRTVTVNQYNTYSREHSRYELYKAKQETAAAVRLALSGGTYA